MFMFVEIRLLPRQKKKIGPPNRSNVDEQ